MPQFQAAYEIAAYPHALADFVLREVELISELPDDHRDRVEFVGLFCVHTAVIADD